MIRFADLVPDMSPTPPKPTMAEIARDMMQPYPRKPPKQRIENGAIIIEFELLPAAL